MLVDKDDASFMLEDAIKRNNIEEVKLLLTNNPDLLNRALQSACTHNFQAAAAVINITRMQNHEIASPYQKNYTPLHVASLKGDVCSVKALVRANPQLCLVADYSFRIPLHIAAANGHEDVIRILVSSCTESIAKATLQNETALHLALKFHHYRAFEVLLEEAKKHNREEILNCKDDEGNTVLHIATNYNLIGIVKLLLPSEGSASTSETRVVMRVNTLNRRGETALDVYHQNSRDITTFEIGLILYEAGAVEGRLLRQISTSETQESLQSLRQDPDRIAGAGWSVETKNVLLVVLVMIAGTAFGLILNMPAVFLDEKPIAMFSVRDVFSRRLPGVFYLLVFNTAGFITSMLTIGFLMWSLPLWTLLIFVLITIFIVYFIVLSKMTPRFSIRIGSRNITSSCFVWLISLAFIFFGYTVTTTMRLFFPSLHRFINWVKREKS